MSETLISDFPSNVDLQKIKNKLFLSLMEVKWLYFHYYHHCRTPKNQKFQRFCKLLMTEETDEVADLIFKSHFSDEDSLSFESFVRFISTAFRGEINQKASLCYPLLHMKSTFTFLFERSPNESIRSLREEVVDFFFGKKDSISQTEFSNKCEKYPFVANLFDFFPQIVERVMKDYSNSPINQEGYLKINSSRFLGLYETWKNYYFICRGGLLTMYESSSCGVPIEVFSLFGSRVYQLHKYNDQVTYRLEFPRNKKSLVFRIPEFSWLCSILYHVLEENGNRNDGFGPVRYNCNAIWYVNGKMFYERVADVLENAKREIFMSCWWLSPQVYLRRGEGAGLKDRFDYIIKKKAEEGVMCYFLVWNHPSLMGRLDCEYVANYFTKMHPNCKILLHPYSKNSYGHHQKMMVIDQEIGLEGGLDICFGRYDEYSHPMSDPSHLSQKWPGKDYWNPTMRTTDSVRKPFFDFVDREKEPRMAWHDVSVEFDGLAARDMAKNFIERWNNSRTELISSQLNLSQKLTIEKNIPYLGLQDFHDPVHFNPKWYSSNYGTSSPSIPHLKKPVKHETNFPTSFTKKKKNEKKEEKKTEEEEIGELDGEEEEDLEEENGEIDGTGNRQLFYFDGKKKKDFLHTCKIQVTRSLSKWSGKTDGVDTSCYQSWIDAIKKAEHYIFIEQQYFFSDTAGFGVQNIIGSEIVKKIGWAIENNKKFRVYIIFPIYPDCPFRDDVLNRIIMYYNTYSTVLGETCIINQIKKKYPNVEVDEYVSVYCLKNWGKIMDRFVIEQVYPHTKMMIVDDKVAIIGSANICDRSFLGDRDSEISATVEDFRLVKTKMNGKVYYASHFAYSLRMFIFNEFLGVKNYDDPKVMDPVCDETYYRMLNTARRNAEIYEEVFPYSPSNKTTDWETIKPKEMECDTNPELSDIQIQQKLDKVEGIIIEYPKKFLAGYLWGLTLSAKKEILFVKQELFQ